ncbi:MAG: TRAP transporter substrate-binding protein [Fimbriimonadaceae bacterium]|nr:TRAP transporter substrate-binding protein [Alphaproteobacteria bacterium]
MSKPTMSNKGDISMRIRKYLLGTMAVLAGISFGSLQVKAADYTLTVSSWAPPSHGVNSILWPRFIKMMEDATGGRVTAEIKYRLAPPPAQFDLVQDGAADFAWIFHGYTPGRFVMTKLIELPGYSGNAEAASVAYWHAHEQFFAAADEHKGVKLIALMTHDPGQLHTNKMVTTLADINGLKLRIGGGVAGDAGTALGATGIRVPAPKVYETLASNAADGVMMPVESRKGFKLTEVAKNMYEMPGGFYRGSFAIIMNQQKFDSLPADIQEALNGIFGEPLARMAGQVWDQIAVEGREVTMATADNTITMASEADQAAYAVIADKIREAVMAEIEAKGVDAKAAYALIKSEMGN